MVGSDDFRMSHKILIPNNITIMAMIICLFVSYLADKVGLSGAIGAFFCWNSCGTNRSS